MDRTTGAMLVRIGRDFNDFADGTVAEVVEALLPIYGSAESWLIEDHARALLTSLRLRRR